MQRIDQVSQDTAKLSICRTVRTEILCVSVFVWFLRGQGQDLCVWGGDCKNQ